MPKKETKATKTTKGASSVKKNTKSDGFKRRRNMKKTAKKQAKKKAAKKSTAKPIDVVKISPWIYMELKQYEKIGQRKGKTGK